MLTAADTIEHRVDGLSLGADDYLPSRSRSPSSSPASARSRGAASPRCRRSSRAATSASTPANASRAGLAAGSSSAPRSSPCSSCCSPPTARRSRAEQLLERAWDEYIDTFSNVVKVTISRLRRKLGEPPAIETVPGGYRIAV